MLLERQPVAAVPESEGLPRLRLRARVDGQLLDLPRGKTTIGSSPRCNVRFVQPGVHPLHCLIDHEPDGFTVRSWASNTLLNGERFEESKLAAGDCLFVGPVELEVLEVIDPRSAKPPTEPSVADQPSVDPAVGLRVGRELARARNRQLLAALRQARSFQGEQSERVADLEQQIARCISERESTNGEFQATAAELVEARRLAAERQTIIDQLARDEATLAAARQALADENTALADAGRRLADENSQLRNQVAELTNQTASLCAEREELRDQQEWRRAELRQLIEKKTNLTENCQRLADEKAKVVEQVAQLTSQNALHNRELDALRQVIEQLQTDMDALAKERAALADERPVICGQRDGFRQQYEHLQRDMLVLTEEKTALADARASLDGERDELRQHIVQLRSDIDVLSKERAALIDERATLVDEIGQLRSESKRHEELEQQVRAAVADRESTSAELYRALLQLAEMEKSDDDQEALVAANQRLQGELERSVIEAAELRARLERLSKPQLEADSARQAPVDESTELGEATQRLAAENAELVARLEEMRQQLDEATQRQASFDAQLQDADAVWCRLDKLQRNEAALKETVARLEGELADRRDVDADATAAIAERERQIADEARQLAESTESVGQLDDQLAAAEQIPKTLDSESDGLERHCVETASREAEQAPRITEVETRLPAVETTPALVAPELDTLTNDWGEFAGSDAATMEAKTWSVVSEDTWRHGSSPATPQPTSFLERVPDVIVEDAATNDQMPITEPSSVVAEVSGAEKPRDTGDARSATAPQASTEVDDEESIEQYMAKLLQRVRGDGPIVPASQSPPASTHSALSVDARTMHEQAKADGSVKATGEQESGGGRDAQSISSFDASAWKPSTPAPTTDLEALRALANESARRAISTHAFLKHRRTVVTKLIVSALAGMTSLWLLLESRDWRDLKLVTACVSLFVAAHWAGQACRTLMLSLSNAYDEPEDELDDFDAPLDSPLPIDVDS